MKQQQQVNTRNIILDILIEINENQGFTHVVLAAALKKYQYLSQQDRAFISQVVRGCVERKITIDYLINCFSNTKTNKMKGVIRNALRMGVYQLVFMEVEDYAACNETVKVIIKRGFNNLRGFVNAVLRKIAANKDKIEYPTLEVKYSTPEWIVTKWVSDFGKAKAEEMLAAQYGKRPLSIRCNTARITPDELKVRLEAEGIKVVKSEILDEAMSIMDYDYLDKIPEFSEGLFFVQDPSSMLVSHIAAPKKDNYVIDLCAAPGGKSMHMAELLKGTGHVEARDLSDYKVMLIADNIDRLELTNVETLVWDATVKDEDSIGKADIVIADLPCSGLGIFSKKPDIKYHATMEGIEELSKLQREILMASESYVKPGGVLVYSTCTVTPEENMNNVKWFLENFSFETESIDEYIPEKFRDEHTAKGSLLLLPNSTEGHDGFFITRFRRKK